MRNTNRKIKFKFLAFLLIAVLSFAFTFSSDDGGKKTTYKGNTKAGDAYRLFINNINMPMNREGVLANVAIEDGTNPSEGGLLDGKTFLFSGGFFLSGKTGSITWANAVASASRIQDYEPGTVADGRTDPRAQLYVVEQKDGDFSQSWQDWKDAVALGAYFHDGNGDGVYDPMDLNGNGKWDPSEDRPDLLGDATVWCVYNDNVDPALRRFNDVDPQGIEIRQTVFGFASKGVTGNMLFVRYSLLNTGTKADVIDSVYFGVWADPDLGNTNDAYFDDLVGCDTTLNSGFVYNNGDDAEWGIDPPCFLIDFFQGPISYIPGVTFVDNDGDGVYTDGTDTPLDTATNVQGQVRGIAELPGARNVGLSSFVHYMQSHPLLGDPNTSVEARNYMLGFDKFGNPLDPCTWTFGTVTGVNCADVDPKYFYSGDPVTGIGWINSFETDQRMMSNTGPFKLEKGKPVDIIAAYVVGRGSDALNSVTLAKEYDITAQLIFDANFPSPPAPPSIQYTVKNGKDFFDITFETADQVTYNAVDTVLGIDRRLQGYFVNAYKTNSKSNTINGLINAQQIAFYELDNFIQNVYQIAPNGGQNIVVPEAAPENKLDSVLYADPNSGRIRLRINADPFDGSPLVKGHEYYFAINHYYLNHSVIVNRSTGTYGPAGDYYDEVGTAYEEFDTPVIRVVFGEDQYAPQSRGIDASQTGASDGEVKILKVNAEQLTGDEYTVEFFVDKNQPAGESYAPFWKLVNNRTGSILIDSSKTFDFDTTKYAGEVKDGFIVKVKPVETEIGLGDDVMYDGSVWYTRFRTDSSTGVYYVGRDLTQGSAPKVNATENVRSNFIRADKLRKVEIRFGDPGKAYRYLNGFKGTPITKRGTFVYATYVTAAETTGTSIGKFGEGFVDVPFTAWVVDERYGEERQLAVGFIEISRAFSGTPDGIWDPGDLTTAPGNEAIVIFDAPYDATGSQIPYMGGTSTNTVDLIKTYVNNDPNATQEDSLICASPWFNAMYVVSLKKDASGAFFTSGDVMTVPLNVYPYTNDQFTFKTIARGELSFDQKKALFEKVNVFPNPLFGYNPATSYANTAPDQPFVTFSNLPEDITIKIFTLSGTLVRTLTTADKSSPTSTFLQWNLNNEDGLRVASGLYLAIVTSPEFGEKILKFSIIMPQKQIERF